jgi:cell pole-organizing protein PopZ
MEEILASIRRIIEDNDTGRKQPGDEEAMRQDHDMPESAPKEGTVIEVDAFRAELRTPPAEPRQERGEAFPMRSQMPDTSDRKQVTLAEVQAKIASEPRPFPPSRNPETPLSFEPRDGSSAPKPSAPDAAPRAAAPPTPAPAAPVTPAAFEEKPTPPIGRAALPEAVSAKPSIISERAERKVAAAFGELSEAFAARAQKTFDEMAEDMMRPMLQDWLDNNLPVLVERLVREEIERVARGAQ